jgi:hypothetical protein
MAFTLIHGAFSYLCARTITKDYSYLLIFTVFAMFPDIDGVLFLFSPELFHLYHRIILHGVLVGSAWALLASVIINKNKLWIFLAAFGGWCSHLVLDLLYSNSFIVPFYPISMWRVYGMYTNMCDVFSVVIVVILVCILYFDAVRK